MFFSYNWIQEYTTKKLPKPKRLAEILAMRSFEVDNIKKQGNDWIFDISITPNRGSDCLCYAGMAREICALLGYKFKMPNFKFIESKNKKVKDFIKIKVESKEDCLRYTTRVIKNVKIDVSPKWLKQRLKLHSLRSINSIVDCANYVMLETGQPLHVFDFGKIKNVISNFQFPISKQISNSEYQISKKKIIIRRAKKDEKFISLDNEEYNLDKDILVIADSKNILAIAGIKGGKVAEIDNTTKDIILESANFDPHLIRKTSKKIRLKTDASCYFEHGIDPNLTEKAINRLAYLIQRISKGEIVQGLIDFYPKKVLPKKIKLDLNYTRELLGLKISNREIMRILNNLKFETQSQRDEQILVFAPTHRLDISIQEDLIEEIGRVYGYEKIPNVFPVTPLILPEINFDIFWEDRVKDILKETMFCEVYNYTFFGDKEKKIFGFEDGLGELQNPLNIRLKYLRDSLIPNMLKNVAENLKYFEKVKIFELGKIFTKIKNQKSKIIEKRRLTGIVSGDKFYEVKGVLEALFNRLGIKDIYYNQLKNEKSAWNVKKSAEIKVCKETIGLLGEIKPKILKGFKIDQKITVFDIDFEKLQKYCSEEHYYESITRHPSAIRDIAILVPRYVKSQEILNKIKMVNSLLIKNIELFDFYEGEEIAKDKKSLAFRIIYQAQDRTLKPKEIDEIQQKIIKILEQEQDWELRR